MNTEPIKVDPASMGVGVKIRIALEETRRYAETVEVFGAADDRAAHAVAREYARRLHRDDVLDSAGDLDIETESVNDETVDIQLNAQGQEIQAQPPPEPLPPADCRFDFDGAAWATTGHLAIRVEAFPNGVACAERGDWYPMTDLPRLEAVQALMRRIIDAAHVFVPSPHANPLYLQRFIHALVQPGDRFEKTSGDVLLVIRGGLPVALVMPYPNFMGKQDDAYPLANILADMAKAQVPG